MKKKSLEPEYILEKLKRSLKQFSFVIGDYLTVHHKKSTTR